MDTAILAFDRTPDIHHALARAFDRRSTNRRAAFALAHSLSRDAGGTWHLPRHWTGVDRETLCEERVRWHPRHGLLETVSSSPSIGGRLEARRSPEGTDASPVSDSRRVSGPEAGPVERRRALPRRGFTLASAPLEIAAAWPRLLRGERLRRQFLVLKVQRHAAVDLEALAVGEREVAVALTPVAWPLRWLFGRTEFHFPRDVVALVAIDGPLDPRDRRRNGRWREYLGRIEFDTPVALGDVVADAADAEAGR